MLYLTERQWNTRMKTIETKNLHKYHITPYWLSISQILSDCIVEILIDDKKGGSIRVVDEDKYKKLKAYCQSESFVMKKK